MEYQEILPPPVLADFVRHFWYIEYANESPGNMPYRIMADGFPSLLFQYKNQFKDTTLAYSFPRSLLMGHTCNVRDLVIDGAFGVFGVALFPYTPYLLYQLPGSIVANSLICSNDLFRPADAWLEERVGLAKSNNARIEILTAYLLQKLRRRIPNTDTLVQYGVKCIIQAKGMMSIESLVNNTGISRRQFERRFTRHVGMNAKLFSRIIRFQNTLRYAFTDRIRNLTSLSFAYGYADQAHFIREFKEFSGLNPRYYFTHQEESAENLIQL